MGFNEDLMGFNDSGMAIFINFGYPHFLLFSVGYPHFVETKHQIANRKWRIPKKLMKLATLVGQFSGYSGELMVCLLLIFYWQFLVIATGWDGISFEKIHIFSVMGDDGR